MALDTKSIKFFQPVMFADSLRWKVMHLERPLFSLALVLTAEEAAMMVSCQNKIVFDPISLASINTHATTPLWMFLTNKISGTFSPCSVALQGTEFPTATKLPTIKFVVALRANPSSTISEVNKLTLLAAELLSPYPRWVNPDGLAAIQAFLCPRTR